MIDRKDLRYWEWGAFAVIVGALFLVLSLVPMPSGGKSEVERERLVFLTMPSFHEVIHMEASSTAEESEALENRVALRSNEEMAALMADAFGASESEVAPDASSLELSSRSSDAVTLEGLDLESWAVGESSDGFDIARERNRNVQPLSSSGRRLPSTLIQPDRTGDATGDFRLKVRPRDEGGGDSTLLALQPRVRHRPPPMAFEDFRESMVEDALAQWILATQSPLDPAIDAHLGVGRGTATARALYETGEGSVELQMMLVPTIGEIRIVLIDGEDLYYFVSPGASDRASYFQLGSVGRDGSGRVVMLEAEDFPPTGAEAQAFYGLFSAWWQELAQ